MSTENESLEPLQLEKYTSRKVKGAPGRDEETPDSLNSWIERYLALAVSGVRSEAVAEKIALHLGRFASHYREAYGHDRISTLLKRDVREWQRSLVAQGLAPSTINNHLASLSAFTTWVHAQDQNIFPAGDPTKGIGDLGLPPLEPRALSAEQLRSLKSVCDRLERFHRKKGREWAERGDGPTPIRERGRPLRDRAIVYVLLSTGLRREELVRLDLDQVAPSDPERLSKARRASIARVKGKGGTERTVFLSADAREALADYIERERPRDTGADTKALFLSAAGIPARSREGRLSVRAVNLVLEQIGRWHDAEIRDPSRHISPLRPHDLRHTFAYRLAAVTGADSYELERRLGHRSQRYIQRYTNPPESVAAGYVEEF
jgi:integrase